MPSTLERLSPTRAKLILTMTQDDLKPALDRAYRDIASRITVPGFRQGKVPPSVIDQRVGRSSVLMQAANDVLPDAYGAAIIEHELAPLGRPEIDLVTLEDGQDAVFSAEVDIRPDFDLPTPDQLEIQVAPVTVDDSVIDERVNLLRERFAETKPVERAAANGDQVSIDLVAAQNGEPLPDATAEGISYVVGSEEFLEGLDGAVTGLSAGDSTTFSSTLVGGTHKDQTADITVTVTQVMERTLPEVDDEFASLVSHFDTVDEMRQDLRQAAERQAQGAQLEQARTEALDALITAAPFELPAQLVEREVEDRTANIKQSLAQANLTLDHYLEQTGSDQTPDQFWAELAELTEKSLRTQVLLEKLADETQVQVTEADLTQYIVHRAESNGTSPVDELKHMQDHNHLSEWMSDIRRNKALAQFLLQITIT
ncbi:MAG: trigger factor, partial [Propionibacteriaceae bacterium]|nr:trigger factor [Propionibacteriaceae bacterium]